MNDREKMTNALIDAVGDIDDRYIEEAQNYRAADIKTRRFIKFASAAASVLLVLTVLFSVLLATLSPRGGNAQSAPDFKVMSTRESSLPKDTAAIIWRRGGDEEYKYVVLDEKTARRYAEKPEGAAASDEPDIRVWIALGNGEYVSPQLKRSAGNVGLDIFGFSPEVELNSDIAALINGYCKEE